jgi:hypothetical protein
MTHLLLVVPARLHRALSIPDLLQHASRVLESLREQIFLLGDLGKQYAKLVANVGEGIVVGALAPVAQLGGDRGALLGRILICRDGVVLRLDQLVQSLGQLGLLHSAE